MIVTIDTTDKLSDDLLDLESCQSPNYVITSSVNDDNKYVITLNCIDETQLKIVYEFIDDLGGSYLISKAAVCPTNMNYVCCTLYTKGIGRGGHTYKILVFNLRKERVLCYDGKLHINESCEIIHNGYDCENFVSVVSCLNQYGKKIGYHIVKITLPQ